MHIFHIRTTENENAEREKKQRNNTHSSDSSDWMRSFRLCGLLPFRVSSTRVLFRLKCLNVQTNKGISNSRADDFQQK